MALPPIAYAQPLGDRAVAEALFRDGRALIEGGQTAAACRKFEESYRLDKAPGTLLNLAHCHKLEGRIASAWSEFIQVVSESRRDGREDREHIALGSIKELEPRIPNLVIHVPPEVRVQGMRVFRSGTELGRAAWGTPTPVDPGEILVEVEAPGYQKWSETISIAEAEQKEATVPALVALPEPEKPPSSAPVQSVQLGSRPQDEGSTTTQQIGLVLGGVGLVGIGVGSYFGVRAISKRSDAEEGCTLGPEGDGCPHESVDLNQDAKDSARIANLGLGIGIVALLAGTYLVLDGAPAKPAESSKLRPVSVGVALDALPGGACATLRGGWR
jgi:hypothetical protein